MSLHRMQTDTDKVRRNTDPAQTDTDKVRRNTDPAQTDTDKVRRNTDPAQTDTGTADDSSQRLVVYAERIRPHC
jgi:hypothetical protein